MISSCSFPSIRSPWPSTVKRLPRAGPKMTPPMPNSRSRSSSNTATSLPHSAPKAPTMRALAQLVEYRRRLVGDKVRLTNRLTSALKNYFPHVLQWFPEKDTAIFCDFLRRWPTLKAAQLARRATLETFFREHHVRYAEVIAPRIQAMKSATSLTTDDGVIAPNALLV